MNKLKYRLSLLVLALLVSIIMIEFLYRQIPNNYSYKSAYIEKHGPGIEILALGGSHLFRGINPGVFDRTCFNFSNVSQSIDYDYRVLKKYIKKTPNLKYVLIPMNYITLTSRLEDGIEHWRKYKYLHYMGINNLTHKDLLVPDTYFTIHQQTGTSIVSDLHRYWWHKKDHITCNEDGWDNMPAEGWEKWSPALVEKLMTDGRIAAERHEDHSYDLNKNMGYMDQIIQLCQENDVQLILITPPATSYYTNHLDQKKWDIIFHKCDSLEHQYPHVHYHNYLYDTTFTDSLFMDGDHVNKQGSELLSAKLNRFMSSLERRASADADPGGHYDE
jgi:hypothetical protein